MRTRWKILIAVAVVTASTSYHNVNKHNDVDPMTAMNPDYCSYVGLLGIAYFMWLTFKLVDR